jgi:eukaryotic-like serine/threonine-protein kinase
MRASHPSAEALVGEAIGDRYRVIQLLRSGGSGHVYLAELLDGPARRPRLAVKVLRPEHLESPDLVARFEREAIAAGRVCHPNVLSVHGAPILEGSSRCFAMELLVGLDLADTLAFTRQLTPARAVRIAHGAAEGLAAAHAAGVIHRDVKPENLFLVHAPDGREMVKLLDFGFSYLPGDPASDSPKVVGTPEYMAPEQAGGAPAHPSADIYSLGIVLYEMLTGRVPFTGEYPAIALHHAQEPLPRIQSPRISRDLAAVLDVALAKHPDDRFGSMAALRDALQALL